MKNVELFEDGRPIPKIDSAQCRTRKNGDKVFIVRLAPTTGAAYALRAHIRGQGGKQSSGQIYVSYD
jgi:hypothetical protein